MYAGWSVLDIVIFAGVKEVNSRSVQILRVGKILKNGKSCLFDRFYYPMVARDKQGLECFR